jgi:SAM-dependent methyltransferase
VTSPIAAAVARLADEFGLGVGKAVVDLGAGAGAGERARLLVATGARVIAIEASPALRAQLTPAIPAVEIVDGTIDALPLPEWTADLVVTADASVWLRDDAAVAEVHRVVRPGGGLALIGDAPAAWPPRLAVLFTPVEGNGAVSWCRRP